MRIIDCIISRHDLFTEKKISFGDGITLVSGRNNSGKSLMARILVDAIGGNPSKGRLLGSEEWNNISLKFNITHNGSTLNISASGEDFILSNSAISGRENSIISQDTMPNDIHPPMFIFNTSLIPSATDMDSDLSIDYNTTRELLLKDTSCFSQIVTRMSAPLKAEQRLIEKETGLKKEIQDLNRQLELLELSRKKRDKLAKEKNIITKEIDDLNIKLSQLLKKNCTLMKIREDLDRIQKLNSDLISIKKRLDSERNKISEVRSLDSLIEKRFPQFNDIKNPQVSRLENLQDLYTEIRNCNEAIDTFYTGCSKRKKLLRAGTLLFNLIIAGCVSALHFSGYFDSSIQFEATKALIFSTAVITPLTIIYSFFSPGFKEPAELKKKKEDLEQRLKPLLSENGLELVGYKLSEIYEFLLQYFEDFIEYAETKNELDEKKSRIADPAYIKRIESELLLLKDDEEKIGKEINDNISFINEETLSDPQQYLIQNLIQDNDTEIRSTEKKIISKERIIEKINAEITEIKGNPQNPEELIQQKKKLEQELDRIDKRRSTLFYLRRTLQEAEKNRETEQLDRLVHKSQVLFNELTDNTYHNDISPSILRSLVTENKLPEGIKQNIRHELVLALKISISEFLVDAGIILPLIIDDPFLFMDNARINHLRLVLTEASQKRQVIIFTHQENLEDWGHLETL